MNSSASIPHEYPDWIRSDLDRSAIGFACCRDLGWRHVNRDAITDIVRFPIPEHDIYGGPVEGYVIPFTYPVTGDAMTMPNGSPFVRIKLRVPIRLGGGDNKPAKYLSPKKAGVHVYIPPAAHAALMADPLAPLYVTEGEKKAVSATSHGFPCLGITGVDCWSEKDDGKRHCRKVHPDLLR